MAMTLRLDPKINEELRATAEREGRSMQEVVTSAVQEYMERRDEFRARQVERFLSEDAELLDLLSR